MKMNKVDKVYQDLLKDILENGTKKGDRTGTGTISVFGRQVRFNMADGFPLLTTKKMFKKGVITELLWFLSGETNIQPLLKEGNNIWVGDAYKHYQGKQLKSKLAPKTLSKEEFIEQIKGDDDFAEKWGDLGPVYGKQWVSWGEIGKLRMKDDGGNSYYGEYKQINQIQNVIDTLKTDPNSRRIMVNAWNVAEIDKMTLPPCHYGFQFNTEEIPYEERTNIHNKIVGVKKRIPEYTEEELDGFSIPRHKLSLMWNQRSVDTFLGLPFNIASYAFLLHMIAQQTNMIPNELIGSLGDTHIYNNHLEQVNEQLSREPMDLPNLILKKAPNIFEYKLENFEIEDYDPHPPIKGELSN